MKLVWNEEFNYNGKPDTSIWIFENGFIRNQELQWYQPQNITCRSGVLYIEAKREQRKSFSNMAGKCFHL